MVWNSKENCKSALSKKVNNTGLCVLIKNADLNFSCTCPIHLFWHLQTTTSSQNKDISDCHFSSDGCIFAVVDHILELQSMDIYKKEIYMFHNCATKFVAIGGDFVEKLMW